MALGQAPLAYLTFSCFTASFFCHCFLRLNLVLFVTLNKMILVLFFPSRTILMFSALLEQCINLPWYIPSTCAESRRYDTGSADRQPGLVCVSTKQKANSKKSATKSQVSSSVCCRLPQAKLENICSQANSPFEFEASSAEKS